MESEKELILIPAQTHFSPQHTTVLKAVSYFLSHVGNMKLNMCGIFLR
jgi:hypothetical protein